MSSAQTPAFQEPGDNPVNAVGDAGDLRISWRGNMPENQMALIALDINPVQCQGVEVRVEIQRVAEALNESDGAAAGAAVRGGNARAPADRGKHGAHPDLHYVHHKGRVVGEPIAQGGRPALALTCRASKQHSFAVAFHGSRRFHVFRTLTEHTITCILGHA